MFIKVGFSFISKLFAYKNGALAVVSGGISSGVVFYLAECGGKYRIWYETHGGYLYGGNEGVKCSIIMDDVLNRGLDEIETLNGVATWRAKFSPERTKSPIYQED